MKSVNYRFVFLLTGKRCRKQTIPMLKNACTYVKLFRFQETYQHRNNHISFLQVFADFLSYMRNKAKISPFLQNFQIFDLIWYEVLKINKNVEKYENATSK